MRIRLRSIWLLIIFLSYGFFVTILGYNISEVTYLFSDEETFFTFAMELGSYPVSEWSSRLNSFYVGLYPSTNLHGTVVWYAVIVKIASVLLFNPLFCLRFVNVLVGYFTAIVVLKYLEICTEKRLGYITSSLLVLPILYFSPTLLRDNYVVLFSFLALKSLVDNKGFLLFRIVIFSILVYLFRHASLLYLLPLLFFHSRYNNAYVLFLGALVLYYYFSLNVELLTHALNYRANFLLRYSDAGLMKLLEIPFPFNELALLAYSLLGVFPFYAYFVEDLPRSIIRWPEMIFSLYLYYVTFSVLIVRLISGVGVYRVVYIFLLFMSVNLELAMRRQMIVFPLLFVIYFEMGEVFIGKRKVSGSVIKSFALASYILLLSMYFIVV